MGINLGALFGPLVCAWFAAHPRFGWSYGFGAAGLSMLLGLLFYVLTRGARLQGIGLPPPRQVRADAARDFHLSPAERRRVLALLLITFFVIFFWLAFEQVGSSLNVFAAERTDRRVNGWLARIVPRDEIPAAWFQAVNPLFVLLLAPLMASLWQRLGTRAPSSPGKMALGLVLLGVAYVVMVAGASASHDGARVSPWYLVSFYFLYSLGELCFLPGGFSFVGQAAPARLAERRRRRGRAGGGAGTRPQRRGRARGPRRDAPRPGRHRQGRGRPGLTTGAERSHPGDHPVANATASQFAASGERIRDALTAVRTRLSLTHGDEKQRCVR
jgi:POT family proton-dependent oligopeptide transporter